MYIVQRRIQGVVGGKRGVNEKKGEFGKYMPIFQMSGLLITRVGGTPICIYRPPPSKKLHFISEYAPGIAQLLNGFK